MSGYEYHPLVKMVPDNGAEVVFDLRTLLTDASGPVRHRLRYRDESRNVEDVNLNQRRINRGLRPEVTLRCDIATMADHTTLATVVSRLLRDDWAVSLSLDAGVTYREVVLLRVPEPRPFRNKTIAGATFDLTLRCVSTVDELAAMVVDPAEGLRQVFTNEGFEVWSAGDPVAWIVSEVNGTIDEDNTNQRTGDACVKMDRVQAGTLLLGQLHSNVFSPGRWAEFGVYAKGSVGITDGLQQRVQNLTLDRWLKDDGTWGTDATAYTANLVTLTTSYQLFSFKFTPDASFADTDRYRMRFYHGGAVGEDIFLDDTYLLTPVLPAGVATW